jgi:hypothetical protein
MFAKVLSSSLLGIDAYTVTVEAHLENASPQIFYGWTPRRRRQGEPKACGGCHQKQ